MTLAGIHRNVLIIISDLLASLQAVQAAYVQDTLGDPMLFRSLVYMSQGLQYISTLASLGFQQIAIHLRDIALFPKQRCVPPVPIEPTMIE